MCDTFIFIVYSDRGLTIYNFQCIIIEPKAITQMMANHIQCIYTVTGGWILFLSEMDTVEPVNDHFLYGRMDSLCDNDYRIK